MSGDLHEILHESVRRKTRAAGAESAFPQLLACDPTHPAVTHTTMATNLRQRTTGNNADSQAGQGASDQNAIQEQLNTIFDPVTCTRKGLCPVTKLRHQEEPLESHSLYFELHGSGPEKIVCIMG